MFCKECGNELDENSKFCNNCGTKVIDKIEERKIVYEGNIHKCPNCGEILKSFVANCPACGYEIRDIKTSSSVKEFAMRLIEARAEDQKINLVRNFPIPNTKEDIFEFMILAASNFDRDISNTRNLKKEEADAWISKIEQSYQKAKLLFGNDNMFFEIQNVYEQTYSKIKKKVKKNKIETKMNLALRTIGLWGGLIIFIIAFFIDIFSYSNTSIYHFGGGVIMTIGALMIGRKTNEILDVGVGIACGIFSIILGTLLQEVFYRNGSMMELAGGVTVIIVVVRLVKSFMKK